MNSLRKIEGNTNADVILNRDFVSITGFVEVGDDKFCLPAVYEEFQKHLSSFLIRDDDVFITGLPKTGTTWCEEMVWLIVNNLDYDEAKKDVLKRVPRLEQPMVVKGLLVNNHSIADILASPEISGYPRCIKTHFPWILLPEQIKNGSKKPKIIYILRNPEDTCISHYYYLKLLKIYNGSFEDFCEVFLSGRVPYGPFWKSVLSYWRERHRPNILFIKYKEMKNSLPATIIRVADFLGKKLTSSDVEKLANHLTFENMKQNSAINHQSITKLLGKDCEQVDENSFIRRGEVDGYKTAMSAELIKRFANWTKENLSETNLSI